MANGIVLYNGKSNFDGKPIVVIATLNCKNIKTGNMVQTWIIREDVNPLTAYVQGKDFSICGNCNHRKWRTCYVNKAQAVYNVYYAYKRGVYLTLNDNSINLIKDRELRIGSYGDPAAVPINVWKNLLSYASRWTGYTHQWRNKKFQAYK
jgi:hypothetical protein